MGSGFVCISCASIQRQHRALILLHQRGGLDQRLGQPQSHHVEGDQGADRHLVAEHEEDADRADADAHAALEAADDGARPRRCVVERQRLRRGLVGMAAPADHRARLQGQRLDRHDPVQDLEQKSLAPALDVVDVAQLDAELARHDRQRDKGDRRYHQHNQSQLPGVDQEDRQKDHDTGEIEKCVEQPARQEVADVVRLLQFVGGDARWVGVEIVDRQFQQMVDRGERDRAVELARDERQEVVAQIIEAAVEQDQQRDPGGDCVQGRESLVRHDLVDQQLEEDWHRQRDQVHRQGGDDDVAHQPPLGEQFRREPGEAEMGVLLARRQRAQDDGCAVPGAFERLARQEERLALLEQRVGDRDLLGGGFGDAAPDAEQHDRVAVVEDQQERVAERGCEKALPVEMPEPGFEAELAGDFSQLRDRHPFAIDQIAPPHRADLGVDAVLHTHPEQTGEAGFRGNERGRRSIGRAVNNDFRLPPLAGLGARPVRYWLFGLHVPLQRGRARPVPPDALGLILI